MSLSALLYPLHKNNYKEIKRIFLDKKLRIHGLGNLKFSQMLYCPLSMVLSLHKILSLCKRPFNSSLPPECLTVHSLHRVSSPIGSKHGILATKLGDPWLYNNNRFEGNRNVYFDLPVMARILSPIAPVGLLLIFVNTSNDKDSSKGNSIFG